MVRPTSRVSRVLMTGPLAPLADAYRAELCERGYTVRTTVGELRQVARLSSWLGARGLTAAELTGARVDEFLVWQRAEGRHRSQWSRPGLRCLLDVLRGLGVLAAEEPGAPGSPTDMLLGRFERYLLAERGLAPGTVALYLRAARQVEGLPPDRGLVGLVAGDVTAAVLRESKVVLVSAAQNFVKALRSFLRFCFIEGLVDTDLSQAALLVRGRSSSPLPKGISRADARALLGSCDRRHALGRRDYAIIGLLLRLGLRRGEVAGLTLDDIDWRASELVVRGKGSRQDVLPLRLTWVRRSPPTCGAGGRRAAGGRCSCGSRPRSIRSLPGRWPRLCAERAGAPGSPRWDRTACGTRRRARWSKPTFRSIGSGRCCAIGVCRAPQSTHAWMSSGCGCWRHRGREGHSDERSASARYDYLRLCRAVGFKLNEEERLLGHLVDYLEAAGASTVSSELAIRWARLPEGVHPNQWAKRLRVARGLAAYLQTIDPTTEIRRRTSFPFAVSAPLPTCSPNRTSPGCWRRRGGCATRCAQPAMRHCSDCSPCPACESVKRSRLSARMSTSTLA